MDKYRVENRDQEGCGENMRALCWPVPGEFEGKRESVSVGFSGALCYTLFPHWEGKDEHPRSQLW